MFISYLINSSLGEAWSDSVSVIGFFAIEYIEYICRQSIGGGGVTGLNFIFFWLKFSEGDHS